MSNAIDNSQSLNMQKVLNQILIKKSLCKVRTITTFVNLTSDMNSWHQVLAEAIAQCERLADAYQLQGYTVQSIRIVTNPFGAYLDTRSVASASVGLEKITQLLAVLSSGSTSQNPLRIRFAIGEAKTVQEITLLPELIAKYGDLCNACVNVPANQLGVPDNELIEACAQTVERIGQITPRGEGNFNFTVNVNCDEFIPYFPASYHTGRIDKGFVIGLETPDLLVAVLEHVNRELDNETLTYLARQQRRFEAMQKALQHHVSVIDNVAKSVDSEHTRLGWAYLGVDTSPAPSKDCASIVEVYKLLDVPYFGASGTVEASSLLTRVFKSMTGINAVGFSGLMLAVTEDTGLAQGTIDGDFDIRALLTYSAVCGIGLDTVPIAGDTPSDKLCALIRDTGTMAYRLNKPLTVRVFPVPNLQVGDITAFESDDLCNCAVLAVP